MPSVTFCIGDMHLTITTSTLNIAHSAGKLPGARSAGMLIEVSLSA
jgi:hypothetical protein